MNTINQNINIKNPSSVSTKPAKASIFYINDVHGQTSKMGSIVSAANQFDEFVKKTPDVDALKISSGDIFIGVDKAINQAAVSFINLVDLTAMTLGNHEFDMGTAKMNEFLAGIKTKITGMNLNFTKDIDLKKTVLRSFVQEINGSKYGIIGLQPPTLIPDVLFGDKLLDGVDVDSQEQTIKELQQEVDKLQSDGVNKIIVISHTGNKMEREIAKNVRGVDVIFGGHSHDLITGVEENKNLFYAKDGAPVLITQAGRDGSNFGVLNLEFDKEGKITKVQNNVGNVDDFPKNALMELITTSLMGGNEQVGVLKYIGEKIDCRGETPMANFTADAMRSEMNADIALLQNGNLRGVLKPGKVMSMDVQSITPFKNRMVKYNLSEDKLVEAIRTGVQSTTSSDGKPGVLQVSGLKYVMSNDGVLKELNFVDNNGCVYPVNIYNPDKNKIYTVALDDFCATSTAYPSLKQDVSQFLEYKDYDKDTCIISYMKKMNNKPFEIKLDGRIQIV